MDAGHSRTFPLQPVRIREGQSRKLRPGMKAGEAMVVAIAPDGARESFLVQVLPAENGSE
ncbi:MAG: hypothetical protein IJ654_05185 [Bacteroidales bacterium]|nr:hypothetical protein [Bacteroidales bacterium]